MNCPAELCLRNYLASELSAEESADFENHMESCGECEQRIQSLLSQQTFIVWSTEHLGKKLTSLNEESPAIPRYTCLELIDSGGFGTVWKMRDHQFNRIVAMKVMKAHYATKESLVRRFFSEAQICSQLSHPFIVPIHSMGKLQDGRGFIAMKWVDGNGLHQHHSKTELGKSKYNFLPRLQTFSNICQGMAYAHEQGVVHRDLKPQNVMVGRHGEVQVMDWGMAKTIGNVESDGCDVDEFAETVVVTSRESLDKTEQGLLGTYPYAAPEQLENAGTVDQRADVFSLGAILCELLTGDPPYAGSDRKAVIRNARNANLTDAQSRLANCGADDRVIQLALNCLAPNPADRPENAVVVAAEIQGYLDAFSQELENERIEKSKRDVLIEQSAKKRRLWAALATILLAATVGLSCLSIFAFRSYRSEQAALKQQKLAFEKERDARIAEQAALEKEKSARTKAQRTANNEAYTVRAFVRAFQSANPEKNGQITYQMTAHEVLQNALNRLLTPSKNHAAPDETTRVGLLNAIGESLVGINENASALTAFREAMAICRDSIEPKDLLYLLTVNNLGYTLRLTGKHDEAVQYAEESVRIGEMINPRRPETLTALDNLGQAYFKNGNLIKASEILKEAFEKRKRLTGAKRSGTLTSMNNYAMSLLKLGRYEEAIVLFEQHLDILAENNASLDQQISVASNYAHALSINGQPARALPILETQLAAANEKYGPSHRIAINIACNLGTTYLRTDQTQKAQELLQRTLQTCESKHGPDHPLTSSCLLQLGKCYSLQSQYEKAVETLQRSYRIQKDVSGEAHPTTIGCLGNLAIAMFKSGDDEIAFLTLEKWVDHCASFRGENHKFTLQAMNVLADCYQLRGRLDDAVKVWQPVVDAAKVDGGRFADERFEAITKLLDVFMRQRRFEETKTTSQQLIDQNEGLAKEQDDLLNIALVESLIELDETEAATTALQPMQADGSRDGYQQNRIEHARGMLLAANNQPELAEPLLIQSFTAAEEATTQNNMGKRYQLLLMADHLIEFYDSNEQPDQAKKWQAKRLKIQSDLDNDAKYSN